MREFSVVSSPQREARESEWMAILRVAIITSIHCVPPPLSPSLRPDQHHSLHNATCLAWLFNLCFVNIQLPHFNVKGENHLELRYIVSKIQWK